MKLALGTVQFGLDYGAFNKGGQVHLKDVRQILDLASGAGVGMLDTAHAYGNSENVLGQVDGSARFRIVTKTPALAGEGQAAQVRAFFDESLARLRVPNVHGLMLHRADDLSGPDGAAIWRELESIRESGKAERIGFSVYAPEEARRLLARFPVQMIQLPLNVFDTRHLDSGLLDLCREKGVEVHVRSVFLQGFALSQPDGLTGHLRRFSGLLERFRGRCNEVGVTPLQGALGFALGLPQVDHVVVGVDGPGQFSEVLAAARAPALPHETWRDMASDALELIEPRRWH
jgi:aryl-alcohol dehydrogenase-like predicted oxidoreductase